MAHIEDPQIHKNTKPEKTKNEQKNGKLRLEKTVQNERGLLDDQNATSRKLAVKTTQLQTYFNFQEK